MFIPNVEVFDGKMFEIGASDEIKNGEVSNPDSDGYVAAPRKMDEI